MSFPWTIVEAAVRTDPAGRGVAGHLVDGRPLAAGHFRRATENLAAPAEAVAIVTGFCIITPEEVVAESDGPPGALFLALALREVGIEAVFISDAYGAPVLREGCRFLGMPDELVREIPFENRDPASPQRIGNEPQHNAVTDAWVRGLLRGEFGRRLTHLVAIERAGPSHSVESIQDQAEQFARLVPPEDRNVCHSMRGERINAHTAKTHRLFEIAAETRPDVATIGIADGGNEIGAGVIPWTVLRQAIAMGPAERVACRIATDHLILAGVSNWGGCALGMSLCALRDRTDLLARFDAEEHRRLIEHLVENSPCVDGVTKQPQPTVDGLPMEEYLRPIQIVQQALGERPRE